MLVTMSKQIGGYRNGEVWPAIGESIDVPSHEAADLIANGYAKEVGDAAPAPDTATTAEGDESEAAAEDGDASDPAESVKPKRTKKG